MARQGLFISFEGGEGAGKSTQIRRLAAALKAKGHDVIVTREPGGSPGGEAVRHVLLNGAAEAYGTRMEALLFAAARSDHVEQVIRPALKRGSVVLCDRFMDSSRVYQGVTGNLEADFIEALQRVAINGVVPDRTIILDLPAELGMERARSRVAGTSASPDRYEKEQLDTQEKRRHGFLDIAVREPERCKVVDATRDEEAIAGDIRKLVEVLLKPEPGKARKRADAPR